MRELETALDGGLFAQWQELVELDPLASAFQSPGWCVPWYRCYQNTHNPFVIVIRDRGQLVGIVPMMVRKRTGEFLFASDSMADYRDIVALPGYRMTIVSELVRVYLQRRFSNPLQVGWIDPASDTPDLLAQVCRQRNLPYTVRHQPCWRWFPLEGENLNKRFSRLRTHLNYFKKQGDMTLDVVHGTEGWASFRDEFFRQHSLRQLHAGRQTSFDDSRKQQLYDMLAASDSLKTHVTALRVNGRLVAGHVGLLWRDVLLFGAPSIRIEDEGRSPAAVLCSWIIQNAEPLGLRGFDLTIGESEFKRRLGNQCSQLTTVEIYGRPLQYRIRTARRSAVGLLKRAAAPLSEREPWKSRIEAGADWIRETQERASQEGLLPAVRSGLRTAGGLVYQRQTTRVYSIAPEQLRKATGADKFAVCGNCIEDLLLSKATSGEAARKISECAGSYARMLGSGHELHTVTSNGQLAGWAYSHRPEEPAPDSGETQELRFDANSVVIDNLYAMHDFNGERIFEAVLHEIAAKAFAGGAARAYVVIPEKNKPGRDALERLGFRLHAVKRFKKLFNRSSLVVTKQS